MRRSYTTLSVRHGRAADTTVRGIGYGQMSERRQRHPAARAFNLIALAIGIMAFGFVVRALGWTAMREAIVGVGAWFAVLAVLDFVGSTCDAAAVYGFVRPHAPIAYRHVFAAQLSGLAINRLTPGNTLGEPVKITMLVRSDVPTDAPSCASASSRAASEDNGRSSR